MDRMYRIQYQGKKTILVGFTESNFNIGSVMIVIKGKFNSMEIDHLLKWVNIIIRCYLGSFGTYLVTGNLCYSPDVLKSPLLQPLLGKTVC